MICVLGTIKKMICVLGTIMIWALGPSVEEDRGAFNIFDEFDDEEYITILFFRFVNIIQSLLLLIRSDRYKKAFL